MEQELLQTKAWIQTDVFEGAVLLIKTHAMLLWHPHEGTREWKK
jgi:hypothetical protein